MRELNPDLSVLNTLTSRVLVKGLDSLMGLSFPVHALGNGADADTRDARLQKQVQPCKTQCPAF